MVGVSLSQKPLPGVLAWTPEIEQQDHDSTQLEV